tara:strand:- start:1730 stop:1975 length:246 start_codon:yes stop_codon:yes gene_type:complete
MEILKLLVQVMTFLLIILGIPNCNRGWIVGNIPLTPQDTVTNTVFIEIVDADSSVHWFHGSISIDGNWCYKHQRMEEVKVK